MTGPPPLDVEGPVRAEIFLVWLNGDRLELTGPDGPVPWVIQLDDVEHPVDAVTRIIRGLVGPPLLVHSTSWRRNGPAVILSFLASSRRSRRSGWRLRRSRVPTWPAPTQPRRPPRSITPRSWNMAFATLPGWRKMTRS
jgi:hypothetical protein